MNKTKLSLWILVGVVLTIGAFAGLNQIGIGNNVLSSGGLSLDSGSSVNISGNKLTKAYDVVVCPEGSEEGICDIVIDGAANDELTANCNGVRCLLKNGIYNICR